MREAPWGALTDIDGAAHGRETGLTDWATGAPLTGEREAYKRGARGQRLQPPVPGLVGSVLVIYGPYLLRAVLIALTVVPFPIS